jgi:RNA polymerase sigma-70 factor (ECF subfamily)
LSTPLHNEEDLLQRLKKDDAGAFTEIFNNYWEKLYAIAYNRLRVKQAAEDVVQEVLSSLWLRRHELDIKQLSGYLATATRYCVFRQLEKLLPLTETENIPLEAQAIQPDMDYHDFKLLQQIVQSEIALLPEKCRLVFTYSRQQQLTNKEIAAELQLSEKTVEAHLTRALRQLRERLKGNYGFIHFLF